MLKILLTLLLTSSLFAKSPIEALKYDADSPSYAFAQFVNFLSENNYRSAVDFSQNSWKQKESDPAGTIKNIFRDYKILSAKITESKINGSALAVITAEITYTAPWAQNATKGIIKANVIREDGFFGVNPFSAMIK